MTTIQPPAPPSSPPPVHAVAASSDSVDAQIEIVRLPPSLSDNRQTLALKGEVVAQNADGTTRINTQYGPVDVKLPDGRALERGQTVEIKIAATQNQPARPAVLAATQTLANVLQETAKPIITDITGNTPPLKPAPTILQEISPRGLIDFLKTTLQNTLKSPETGMQPTPQTTQPWVQKPLGIGQLARLTPLLTPIIQTNPTTPPSIAQIQAHPLPTLTPTIQQPQPAHTGTTQLTITPINPSPTTPLSVTGNSNMAGTTLNSPSSNIVSLPQSTGTFNLSNAPKGGVSLAANLPIASSMPATAVATSGFAPQSNIVLQQIPQTQTQATSLDVRITALLPTAPQITVQNASMANLVHGTPQAPAILANVIGETPQGLPILELPSITASADGFSKPSVMQMVLQFPAKALPPQSIIRMDILPQNQSLSPLGLSPSQTMQSPAWSSIDDLLNTLRTEPQSRPTMQMIQDILPKPGGTGFTAPVMMLAAALRSGDINQWLGQKTVDTLTASKRSDGLMKIANDFSTQREPPDAPKTEWRNYTLPFLYGQEVHRISLHAHSFTQDDETSPSKKKTGTRFVLDIALNRMGPMQIDGFTIDRKLDVTLRSEQSFSPPMRERMRAQYALALDGIGFAGQLNFNADPARKGWISF